jgi:hypothetical protein
MVCNVMTVPLFLLLSIEPEEAAAAVPLNLRLGGTYLPSELIAAAEGALSYSFSAAEGAVQCYHMYGVNGVKK